MSRWPFEVREQAGKKGEEQFVCNAVLVFLLEMLYNQPI